MFTSEEKNAHMLRGYQEEEGGGSQTLASGTFGVAADDIQRSATPAKGPHLPGLSWFAPLTEDGTVA